MVVDSVLVEGSTYATFVCCFWGMEDVATRHCIVNEYNCVVRIVVVIADDDDVMDDAMVTS